MTQRFQVYRCDVCRNTIKVVAVGRGELVCCGKPMRLLEEKCKGTGMEKHVPVVERTDTGIKVTIGAIPHPMEDRHFVEWIEVRSGPVAMMQYLRPGEKAEATFPISGTDIEARCYCTVHEIWTNR